jgi:hypothetical protein
MRRLTRTCAGPCREGFVKRLTIPLAALLVLAVFVILYLADRSLYGRLLTALMLRPFAHPFIDWEWIPSAVDCWRHGVDVYLDNTCYAPVTHGRHTYSPLWLRATFLSSDQAWVNPIGLAIAVLFVLSLGCLPPPRRRRDFVVTLLATISSLTIFAIERGNVDLIMFLLAITGINLWFGRLPLRLAGYAVFTFAGLLKFYPLVLLILALRERVRIFALICVAVVTVLIIFILSYQNELSVITRVIPHGSYFTDWFGAVNLPYGLATVGLAVAQISGIQNAWVVKSIGSYAPAALLALLALGVAMHAMVLAGRHGVRNGLVQLPPRDAGFLVAGAALTCGCFFAGQSIGYRGIFLLFTLPGLLRLSQTLPSRSGRGCFLIACIAIPFVMWVLCIQYLIGLASFDDIDAPHGIGGIRLMHWMSHEIAWWWIVDVLLSILVSFVLNSEIWQTAGSNAHPLQ